MDTSVGMLGDRSSELSRLGDRGSFTQMCDEYESYCDMCVSDTGYFEYREKINGYTCIYPLNENEAIEYHKTGKLPQHVLDDIEFDKQTL